MNRRRSSTAVMVALLGVALLQAPAQGAFGTTVTDGVLQVLAAGAAEDDSVVIDCDAGDLKVNGVDPATGQAPCDAIVAIIVVLGEGNDVIDVSSITGTGFPALEGIVLVGGPGNDHITGPDMAASLSGDEGDDTLIGGDASDTIRPGTGTNTVQAGSGIDVLVGEDLAATTVVSDDSFVLDGEASSLSGLERISATITGAISYDGTAFGGRQNVRVEAPADVSLGPANDTIDVSDGPSLIDGGGGKDTLQAGVDGTSHLDPDTLSAPFGKVTLGAIERAEIFWTAHTGKGYFDASNWREPISFSSFSMEGSTYFGGKGPDFASGGPGNDVLKGGAGQDALFGSEGKDYLDGGPARDECAGGSGKDTLHRCNP